MTKKIVTAACALALGVAWTMAPAFAADDTKEKMGQLTFSDLEIKLLTNDKAVVIGRWLLKRTSDEPHGRFTLIFKKTRQGWRIIHDHTSSA